MHDQEQFWRASEMHAHVWIRAFEHPVESISPGYTSFSRIYVCPQCGVAWGKRNYITAAPQVYCAVERPCLAHGGGGLTRGRDYDSHREHSDDFLAFAIDQHRIDPSVLDFHD